MMVKLLQDTYVSSPLLKDNLARTDLLLSQAAPRKPPPKVSPPLGSLSCSLLYNALP